MPAALKVDWPAIRAMHAAGVDVHDLAEKFKIAENTIRRRIERGNWKADRLPSQSALTQHTEGGIIPVQNVCKSVVAAASVLQDQKEKFLASGGSVAVKGMEQLSSLINNITEEMPEAQRLERLAEIASVAGELMKTGKPVFGLNDTAQVNVGVQVGILSEIPEVDVLDQL